MDLCASSDRYRNGDSVHNNSTAAAVAAAAASVYPSNYLTHSSTSNDNLNNTNNPSNSGSLLFWPWAAAAAANGYYNSAAAAIDFEQHLYKFGYNPTALISAGNQMNSIGSNNVSANNDSNNTGYSQNLLPPSDIAMQNSSQYLTPNNNDNEDESDNNRADTSESANRNGHIKQNCESDPTYAVNSEYLTSPLHQKSLSRPASINNDVIQPPNGSNSVPPIGLPTPPTSPNNNTNLQNPMTIKPPIQNSHLIESPPQTQFSKNNKFLSPLSNYGNKYSGYSRPYFNYHSAQSQNQNCMETGPTPTKGYKCKMCQQLCFSKHDLARHNASAHKQDPRPYRCEHCGRQFSTGAYLGQHRRIHLGIKPYICRFCDRRFTQLSHVQQHERIHTGEKPYRCLACLKSFTQMSNLQSHQRQHMKGKPYRCEHCFMCFDVQEELDTHVQAKHAGHKYSKILVCPICGKNYNSETYLNKHILKHKESAAAANMSVMAAAVNAVAVAAAHLPRAPPPGNSPNLLDNTSASGMLLDSHGSGNPSFYYPHAHTNYPSHHYTHYPPQYSPHNTHPHHYHQQQAYLHHHHHHHHQTHQQQQHQQQHRMISSPTNYSSTNSANINPATHAAYPYFNNSAFMNPDHFMSSMNNHLFVDPFESAAGHFTNDNPNPTSNQAGMQDDDNSQEEESEGALCMKKNMTNDEERQSTKKSKENPDGETKSPEDTPNPNKLNLESVLFAGLNCSNLPVINFDTSGIDEQMQHDKPINVSTPPLTSNNSLSAPLRPQPIIPDEYNSSKLVDNKMGGQVDTNNNENNNNSQIIPGSSNTDFVFPNFRI